MILKSVGGGGANQLSDVVWVQERLNKCNAQIVLPVDGVYSPKTAAAIDYFQGRFLGMTPTGLVTPNEGTAIKLSQTPNGCWAPKDMLRLPPGGTGRAMQPTDFERAAGILNIELPVIKNWSKPINDSIVKGTGHKMKNYIFACFLGLLCAIHFPLPAKQQGSAIHEKLPNISKQYSTGEVQAISFGPEVQGVLIPQSVIPACACLIVWNGTTWEEGKCMRPGLKKLSSDLRVKKKS